MTTVSRPRAGLCLLCFALGLIAAPALTAHEVPCTGGMAGGFPCDRVDLVEQMTPSALGGSSGNDVWGWTDPVTGREYALMGLNNGTAFVDITGEPELLGNLPTHTSNSTWRDIKVYQDHAYIVSEASGHGIQVFDLTVLRDVVTPPVVFTATAHYAGFGSAHNIVINEDSGFAYGVGANCSGGLHFVDLSTPDVPVAAGCFTADGYTHDAQCVTYAGPDPDHQAAEVCFACNEDTLTVVDVTDKANPAQLSRSPYAGSGYTHQGWLTEDHLHFLLDDETDEIGQGHGTKTYIWDVSDLDNPSVIGAFISAMPSTDHNQYVHEGFLYQANYRAGLRILSLDDVAAGTLAEVAYFDTQPASNSPGTSGAWSVYPYFASGQVIVSDSSAGLFVLRPQLCSDPLVPGAVAAAAAGPNSIEVSWTGTGTPTDTYSVYRSFGSCPGGGFKLVASGLTGTSFTDAVSGQVEYAYTVTAVDETGLCESPVSGCSSATTTGACTAEPVFTGLEEVTNPAGSSCSLDLSWNAATPNCGVDVTYSVYRDTTPGFTPSAANRVASGLAGTTYSDAAVSSGQLYAYVVRAVDTANDAEEGNFVEATGVPTGPISDGSLEAGAEIGDPTFSLDSISTLQTPRGPVEKTGPAHVLAHIGWEQDTARFHTGDRSYFSTYANDQCSGLSTPPLQLTAGESSELRFWTVYDIESRFDGGVVEISDDAGASWAQLFFTPPYPNTFRSSSDACGYTTGTPSFTGTDLTWTEYVADLSAFSGSEVLIRWVFSTDGGATDEGWYVDDVTVTHVQVPGPCTTGVPLFDDGFESGGTSAWTVVQSD